MEKKELIERLDSLEQLAHELKIKIEELLCEVENELRKPK